MSTKSSLPREIVRLATIAIVAIVVFLTGCTVQTPPVIEYTGRILDENTQQTIPNAKVSFEFQGAPPIVYTDTEGVYRFTLSINQDKIDGQVRVEADGYDIYERYITIYRDIPGIEDIRLSPSPVLMPTQSSAISASVEGRLLLGDNFEGDLQPWLSIGDCVSPQCTIADGVMKITEEPLEIRIPNSILYENFSFEVKVCSLSSKNWRVALRLFNSREEYYFFIISKRYDDISFYQFKKADKSGAMTDLIPATEVYDSYFTKEGDFNSLKLIAKGTKFELYLNDVLLDIFKETSTIDGMLSFVVLNGTPLLFDDIRIADISTSVPPSNDTSSPSITESPTAPQSFLPTETQISQGTTLYYLHDVFFWWTLTGDLRGDAESDKYLLSAFYSILSLDEIGIDSPENTMQSWIDDAIVSAIKAGICTTKEQCSFLKFNTSGPFSSLDVEESFWRLWEHVNKLKTNETTISNMAAIRLALSALVGEDRQQELIGIWNDKLK